MKRILAWLLCPVFFASLPVVSTEVNFELSPATYANLHELAYDQPFHSIPTNPNVFEETATYLDKNLIQLSTSIFPNDEIVIQKLLVNDKQELVFLLENGQYLPADKRIVFDDIVLSNKAVNQTYYLYQSADFLTSPIRNQAKSTHAAFRPYQPVTVTELSTTPWGEFAYVDGKGWIDIEDLSTEDLRIEAVQELLDNKYNNDQIAIYVKQLSTQKTAGVNQTKQLYSASISKLPLLYYVQEQVNAGKVQLTDALLYSNEVNTFQGSYNPWGSGSISKEVDNLPYAVGDLMDKIAKESDNVASNLLGYYVAGSYGKDYQRTIEKILGKNWDMTTRMASPEMAGLVMEALYEQNGRALQSLTATQFDNQRIPRDIPVPVAHKIGDADEFRHDVAVVYAGDPFILSIFTENADYELISQIANDVYGILQ